MSPARVKDTAADGLSPILGMNWKEPAIISAWGAKGSGKSVLNRVLFRSWDLDGVCIDVNGNAEPGEHAERVSADGGSLPTRFPDALRMPGEPARSRTLHFRAHPGDPRYREQLDQAVGMALYPQRKRVALWAGEVGELCPNGRPGPHMRTLLMQNRHYNVTALFDGPRPVHVPPLVLGQSNLVAVFRLPNPRDRERIADEIGFPPKLFHEAAHACWRTEHAFLLWDGKYLHEHEPLPAEALG